MTKTYFVAGSSWLAVTKIPNTEKLPEDSIRIEAATRAIEGFLGMRDDIVIEPFIPIKLTKKQMKQNPIHASLVNMLNEELETGCGIGAILCVMNEKVMDGGDSEWYVNSKLILENAGVPKLVNKFVEKYPSDKNS